MILQFTIGNYRSFHERQTLNFRPSGLVSENKKVDRNNILEDGEESLLRILGVYGSNGSGKSNIIKALAFFRGMVSFSLTAENFLVHEHNPFKFVPLEDEDSGYFQMVLVLKGKRYRYGFSLNKNSTIREEWLYGPADRNETYYFLRKGTAIEMNEERFKEGLQLPYNTRLRADALFLTFCSAYDGDVTGKIKDYLNDHVIIEGAFRQSPNYGPNINRSRTNNLIKTGHKGIVLRWLAQAGLFYSDIELRDIEGDTGRFRNYVLLTKIIRDQIGEEVKRVVMNLDTEESEGTKKFYVYIGGLYELFTNGGLYISDEIDNNFHSALLQRIIRLFQSPAINRAGAQLLFTSHDVNLMNPNIMRRDQFYFTEKNKTEETRLFSLASLNGIRNNADFARQYLSGHYGALPALETFSEDDDSAKSSNTLFPL